MWQGTANWQVLPCTLPKTWINWLGLSSTLQLQFCAKKHAMQSESPSREASHFWEKPLTNLFKAQYTNYVLLWSYLFYITYLHVFLGWPLPLLGNWESPIYQCQSSDKHSCFLMYHLNRPLIGPWIKKSGPSLQQLYTGNRDIGETCFLLCQRCIVRWLSKTYSGKAVSFLALFTPTGNLIPVLTQVAEVRVVE